MLALLLTSRRMINFATILVFMISLADEQSIGNAEAVRRPYKGLPRSFYCITRSDGDSFPISKQGKPRISADGEALPFLPVSVKERGEMEAYTHVQCLFCETGKEKRVVEAIHEMRWGHALFAQRVKTVWRGQEWVEETAPLLPGYVFVYQGQDDETYRNYLNISHVIRVLTYGEGQDKLTGRDLEFADWLWRVGGEIGVLKAVREGDRVEITDGAFKALHGTITRMNRRRKKICVSLDTQGIPMQIWLSYELCEKENEGM